MFQWRRRCIISNATFRCRRNDLDPEAICLAKELGALSLALEQAAAYISSSPLPLNFKDYLNRYKEVKFRLLKQQHATALSLEAQHRLSTHTTWMMNFEYVKERSPAAAKIMRISAFFESEFIPIKILDLLNSIRRNWEKVRFLIQILVTSWKYYQTTLFSL